MPEHQDVFNELLMAQQPIFTRDNKLFGYELLFRGENELQADFDNNDQATSQLLSNLCMGITSAEARLGKPFFINLSRDLLLSEGFFPMDPGTVYVEILEGQKVDSTLTQAVCRWKKAGYRFVLDDYQFEDDYDVLLPLVEIVKVDVLATPPQAYRRKIDRIKAMGILLVAEKVEDQRSFDECLTMGFDLFQGYYLERPSLVKGKRIHSDTQVAMQLINRLRNEDITMEEVSSLVAQDPKLAYQMLRLLNSPVFALSRKIESLKEAVVFLGLTQIRKWAFLITLVSASNRPVELFRLLLTRARCCELMHQERGDGLQEAAFTVGLLSAIDAVLEIDRKLALDQLALEELLTAAILDQSGALGTTLKQVYAFEQADSDALNGLSHDQQILLSTSFASAVLWANDVLKGI